MTKEKKSDDMLKPDEMKALAQHMLETLKQGVTPKWSVLETPQVLGALFKSLVCDDADMRVLELEGTLEAFVGQVLRDWLPGMVELHDVLMKRGLGRENRYEFGNDAYVYAVADWQVRKPTDSFVLDLLTDLTGSVTEEEQFDVTDVKAFVLETQSRQFIVVLNRRYSEWSIHIREFYECLAEQLEEGGYLGALNEFKDRKDLTIHDVVRLSEYARKFADDVPGNSYPSRLSLKTFLDSELLADDDAACPGLRYTDARDVGYIASLKGRAETPEVEDMAALGYADVAYVTFNLRCAFSQLVRPLGSDPDVKAETD